MSKTRRALFGALPFLLFSSKALAQDSQKEVDALLVLAMDVSASVTETNYAIQLDGYASAFRDPKVISTITTGYYGRIAVTFAQWSDWGSYKQMVPWTVIGNSAESHSFASKLLKIQRAFQGSTSISGAISSSMGLIEEAPYSSKRRVIDISGDGVDDSGSYDSVMERMRVQDSDGMYGTLATARALARAAGIMINGLAIEGAEDAANLTGYYEDFVICGEGSFVETIESPDDETQFAFGIRKKIRREIM